LEFAHRVSMKAKTGCSNPIDHGNQLARAQVTQAGDTGG
jgi:hypothetical protein